MATEIVENIFCVNAPAGSGKTTKIKSMIVNHKIKHPIDNILCITYTKRASEELNKDFNEEGIHISTIHSFLHKFLKIYFCKTEMKDLYFEMFEDLIRESIENKEEKEHIVTRNQKYIEKHGCLSVESIKANINAIYYNESSNNHLYTGGLSHDSLLLFAEKVFDKFPKIKMRLTQKYQSIFIDEYQDSAASVLRMFYKACLNTKSNLYFLGDKMQQIYKNYDGSFEEELKTLNTDIKLDINHRSIPDIVSVLNNIYNDKGFKQNPSKKNLDIKPDHPPRIIMCDNIQERLKRECSIYPDALLLFLLNQQKFASIGARELYKQFSHLERYSHAKQLSATDVLSDNTSENTDPLLKLLFIVGEVVDYYEKSNVGSIIQIFKANHKLFDMGIGTITSHQDRIDLNKQLKQLYEDYQKEISISEFLTLLRGCNLFKSSYIDNMGDEYLEVLKVKLNEFKALSNYLRNPAVSTQHGVKGESHNTVFFIAEDSFRTPIVHMHKFLKLWTIKELTLDSLESFYYDYNKWIEDTISHLGCKISDLNKESHNEHKIYLKTRVEQLCKRFEADFIFKDLCEESYSKYILNPNVTNIKKCFKESTVYGVLSAYKLFYVGCSRARRNLSIFVDKSKVEGFSEELIAKLKSIGFSVEVETKELQKV
ncbi:UvrD-helicase domain-containing protein [Bacillus paranthracis]|uniref:UvrD-helicase domain-containing protein n=1 Tax=Bacillus cereus group TaxID=86661 RepID=UPI0022E5CFBB|nr:UvrD-helicase domain-containing protein [Bacillus cereus group sp. Bc015]MBL3847008.1 ATP-dependent helicase [Bacillus cereus]MDA2736336.1 AAA family ATPase [Bacillus cereus group sp. Bc015]